MIQGFKLKFFKDISAYFDENARNCKKSIFDAKKVLTLVLLVVITINTRRQRKQRLGSESGGQQQVKVLMIFEK